MTKLKKMLFLKVARKLNKNSSATPVPTIISEGSKIIGDVISGGILHVDGRIEGDVTCEELVIGVKGSVSGNITSKNLHLYGVLKGSASVDNLFISKSAKLLGDVTHNTIAVEPGAYIDGHCIRNGGPIPAEQGKADLMITDKSQKHK